MWDGTGEAQGMARVSMAMVGKIEDVGKRQDGCDVASTNHPVIHQSRH
jgi:hypothetical protein